MKMRFEWRKRFLSAGIVLAMLVMTGCQNSAGTREPGTGAQTDGAADSGAAQSTENPADGVTKADPGKTGASSAEEGKDGQKESTGQESAEKGSTEQGSAEGTKAQDAPGMELFADETGEFRILTNLGVGKELLSENFFKAGDINTRLSVYLPWKEDPMETEQLGINLFTQTFWTEEDYAKGTPAEAEAVSGSMELHTSMGKTEYTGEAGLYTYNANESTTERVQASVAFYPEEGGVMRISVEGLKQFDGDYYPNSSLGENGDLFSRYYTRAELCGYPTEVLGLMRNMIYAGHGRKFQSEVLSDYFGRMPWYRPVIETDKFSDDMLSDVEKKNIRLISELEKRDAATMEKDLEYGIENFKLAPYTDFLDINREAAVQLQLDTASDQGLYWTMKGQVLLPITMTRGQWKACEEGKTVGVVTDELAGTVMLVERLEDGRLIFYEKGNRPQNEIDYWEVNVSLNYDTGLYELWQASDDTMYKPVYEGEICVLKGAVCGGHLTVTEASRTHKEIDPEGEEKTVGGNKVYHNGRGYLTAVYYLGD